MILGGLIEVLVALLVGLCSLLPTYTPPPAADLGAFQVIAWLIPVGEILTLSTAMIVFAVASVTFVAVNWLINKVRGSG